MRLRSVLLAAIAVCLPLQAAANDADLRDALRLRALQLVNRERALHGLRPVSLDLPTSFTADRFCEEQLRDAIAGHYSLDGVAPYMRYPWEGSRDMLRENVASWSANYTFEKAALPDLIGRSHRTMMNERPPDDGHRRAILDPLATHMAFGIAWRGGELRFAQVFLRRAIDWTNSVPSVIQTGEPRPVITGRPRSGYSLEGVTVHWEPLPRRLSHTEIRSRTDYALPANRRDYSPVAAAPASPLVAAAGALGRTDLEIDRDGSFRFVPDLDQGPGVYTAVFWIRRRGDSQPIAAGLTSFRVVDRRIPASGPR